MRQAVVVVCDSLRRDMLSDAATPNLNRISKSSAVFSSVRGVFPSVTRVTSASIATGCFPGQHGLLGNMMALLENGGLVGCSAGEPLFRDRMRVAFGRTLTRRTLAQRVAPIGEAVIYSNVSPGGAYFHDPDNYGYVFHRAGSYRPGGGRIEAPDDIAISVGAQGDAELTDRFCAELENNPNIRIATLWLSEPDSSSHFAPLGSPDYFSAVSAADACVQHVWDRLNALDPNGDEILRLFCSDHGMETVIAEVDIANFLVNSNLKASATSDDVVVCPNGNSALIFMKEMSQTLVVQIAEALRDCDWVEQVFLPSELGSVGLAPRDYLALAVDLASDEEPNAFGVHGRSYMAAEPGGNTPYVSMHGGLGRFEQSPFLFAYGGGFEAGEQTTPASLVDIAPTVLRHLELSVNGVDGTPLSFTRSDYANVNPQPSPFENVK